MPGSVLGWAHTETQEMTKESDAVWFAPLGGLTANSPVEFKFTGGGWNDDQHVHGIGDVTTDDNRFGENNGNIEFTPAEDGTYKISFNILTKQVSAEKQ
ncbi:hypothetical protein JCM19240_2302 [Vibrio maritimus]|uniref:Uncharacterized protein n=1 Tax=Vibrio maritimus TaxID=990268 RepID=A0A090T0Z6_9VIBR|nr:hypothetical protein JCM19240_2302 [Vibrio maritimus]